MGKEQKGKSCGFAAAGNDGGKNSNSLRRTAVCGGIGALAAGLLTVLAACTHEPVPSPQAPSAAASQESDALEPAQAGGGTGDRKQLDAFVEELDRERSRNLYWTKEEWDSFKMSMPGYSDQLHTYTEEEMEWLSARREACTVSAKQAREDVESYFNLLRTTYGGYEYFGGDEIFLPIQDKALAELPDNGEVTAGELEELLCKGVLDVVTDGHFMIGSRSAVEDKQQYMYYVPGLYLEDIQGMDPAYVRPTIGPLGEITYGFAALSHDGRELPETVAGPDGQDMELHWVQAPPFEGWKEDSRIPYERKTVEELPVLVCETLDDSEEPQPLLEFLGLSGKEYRSLPVFAVDLRGNWGGNDGYARQWIEGFTGTWPQPKMIGGFKFSQLCMKVRGEYESQRQQELGTEEGLWGEVRMHGAIASNSNLVFVLTDYNTASAAEDFVSYLRNTEHTVTVGSNTCGCQTFGNIMQFYLPNSGLRARMGASFFFWDTSGNREGAGYLPDLWVNPSQALEAVNRLCDYYGLK